MTNQAPSTNDQVPPPGEGPRFDLGERTAKFGKSAIALAKRIRSNPVTAPLISQLVRAATSIGANYCEAEEADSKKEFRYRIGLCKRESKETRFHFRMVVAAEPDLREDARTLWQEAKELTLIFSAILRSSRT